MVLDARIIKKQYEVTYQIAPAWMVCEDGATRRLEATDRAQLVGDDHYPDDYAGRIQSCKPTTLKRGPVRTRGFWRSVVVEMTAEQRTAAANRTVKIERGALVPVTDPDRWGERLWAGLRDTTTVADLALETPADAGQEVAEEFRLRVQMAALRMRLLKQALPQNIAHTGTGLYAVKASPLSDGGLVGSVAGQVVTTTAINLSNLTFWLGGYLYNETCSELRAIVSYVWIGGPFGEAQVTVQGDLTNWVATDVAKAYDSWNTVQGACDQLWTDQGVAAFTANQYIRVYAGTYVENVAPNAGLNTSSVQTGSTLILEGDPTDSRDNIVIACAAGNYDLYLNNDYHCRVRHLKTAGDPAIASICFAANIDWAWATDLTVDVSGSSVPAHGILGLTTRALNVLDSEILFHGDHAGLFNLGSIGVHRCKITGDGAASGIAVSLTMSLWMEACLINNVDLIFGNPTRFLQASLRNCVLYNIGKGFNAYPATLFILINNIVHTATTVFLSPTSVHFPEETAGHIGPRVVMRNNYFYNYTNFADFNGTTKTYAEWIAYSQVDASDNVDGVDPKVAGTGLLDADSPCINGGIGSGVLYDVNNVAAPSLTSPAIGCDFSRDAPVPSIESRVGTTILRSGVR